MTEKIKNASKSRENYYLWLMKAKNTALALLLFISTVIGLTGCGHSDSFKVKGELTDGASINLRLVYYVDNTVRTALTASIEGKFNFEGHAPEDVAVEVYDNEYRLLGRFVARNGDDIALRLDHKNAYLSEADGNEVNRELTRFYNDHAEALAGGSGLERNRLIADYVSEHPDSRVAQLLMATEFDASTERGAIEADSLINLMGGYGSMLALAQPFVEIGRRIADDASREPIVAITYKNRANKVDTYTPGRSAYSLIAVADTDHGRDSVVEAIRALMPQRKRVEVLELSVDPDTMIWSRTIRRDSAEWKQGWAAGSISGQSLGRLAVPKVPYFIVTDSTGRQLWRGGSATEMNEFMEKLLKRNK